MNRREAIAVGLALGATSAALSGSPSAKRHRIGFLGLSSAAEYALFVDAFRDGLRELGYEEGRNLVVDYRWAEGREERLPQLAGELVRLQPDVIVTHAAGVRAAQQATATIPIVMGVSADPVETGLIKSLARPGGNTTGVTSQMVDVAAKRLQLLAQAVPGLAAVAVISLASSPAAMRSLDEMYTAASALGVRLLPHPVSGDAASIDAALNTIQRQRPGAILVQPDPLTSRYNRRIAELALRNAMPTMGGGRAFATDGGLMAYGSDFIAGWRLAARYVDRILKGAKPAQMPVEQPTRFVFVINAATARALRLEIPRALLLQATELLP